MAELQKTPLLNQLFQEAEALAEKGNCSSVTRDHFLAAVLLYVEKADAPGENPEEDYQLKALCKERLSGIDADSLLSYWAGKEVSFSEKTMYTMLKGQAVSSAKSEKLSALSADFFLNLLLKNDPPALKSLRSGTEPQPASPSAASRENPEKAEEAPEQSGNDKEKDSTAPAQNMELLVTRAKQLQQNLQNEVLGQDYAISIFSSGYFQSELQSSIDKERTSPKGIFLFAGPPGVGKTFLAKKVAQNLNLPFRRFNMSEYANPNAVDELSGSDGNYKASSEGQLTSFVARNPRSIVLLDEIEKASLDVIHLFLQILDDGVLRDNKTDIDVSFRDTLLIFTTNAGKGLYENSERQNLSTLSRDAILDALGKDLNPKTKEPLFPAAICSRFASGNVLMFNHLEAHTLQKLLSDHLQHNFDLLREQNGISVDMEDSVPTALLLAEGASADARMVISRANSFFGGELYELFRNVTSEQVNVTPNDIKNIHIRLAEDGMSEEIRALFKPNERVHAMVFSDSPLPLDENDSALPVFHYVHSLEEAQKTLKSNRIRMIFCKPGAPGDVLNREDVISKEREFMFSILESHPDIPLMMLESEEQPLAQEEKSSYFRRGVQAFIALGSDNETLYEQVAELVDHALQQSSLIELARANKLITFETSQQLSEDCHTATITLFDFRMKTAVKAEDSNSILSMFSRPDVRFSDIIGADSAKSEMLYYGDYIRNPWKYASQGVQAPKGILLYGPPGTGKTMLAKAFAAEVNATFIATEGNRFYKGFVGQGAETVHKLFAAARRYAPAVIFIDEIDTIARARTGRDTDLSQDSEQILTAFFAEMDGFSTNSAKPVIVLGATNYGIEAGDRLSLDPAMLRRFDRRILIDLPEEKDRLNFLKRQIREKHSAHFDVTDAEIQNLSERSVGMSLAQLSSVIEMALRNRFRTPDRLIDGPMLDETFETFVSGDKKQWDAATILRTARHEAGHALLSWLSGEKPSYVTIISRGDHGGYMQHASQEDKLGYTKQELLTRIRTALGGRAAELVCYGDVDGLSTGASGDLKTATLLAKKMICSYGMMEQFGLAVVDNPSLPLSEAILAQINTILAEEMANALETITAHRNMLDRLVEELRAKNTLNGDSLNTLLTQLS